MDRPGGAHRSFFQGVRDIFATRRARRRLYVNVAAFSGAFVAILQIALWVAGADLTGWARTAFIGALVGGIFIAVFQSIPKQELHLKAKAFTAELHLVPGDIFEPESPVRVLTANRHFDVDEPWVSRQSLIGQLGTKLPDGLDTLRKTITVACGELEQREAAEPGATVCIPTDNLGDVLLLAVAARNQQHRSTVLVDDISRALTHLWDDLRRRDATSAIVPVIGSGYARAQVGLVPLLLMQVTSYVISSMEVPICSITIVLPPDDLNHDLIRLVEDYCRELGLEAL